MTDSIRGRTPALRSNRRPYSVTIERLESRELLSVVPAATAVTPVRTHPVPVKATEGQPFTNATVATLTADPAATFTATIDWGDKTTLSTAAIIPDGAGGFTVDGSHDYVKFGFYVVKVQLTDNSNKTRTIFSNAKVADAALAASGIDFTTQKGATFAGPVATFTDADPNAVVSPKPTETATINWGDGTSSAGTIGQATPGGPFTVFGKHTYGVAKIFTVTTIIHDPGGAKATATSQATVLGPQPTTSPSLVGDYKGSVKVNVLGFSQSLSFELQVTSQDINGITGTLLVEGVQAVNGTIQANGVGELTNGNFKYTYTNGSISVLLSGHVSSDGKHITSGFVMASGLPVPGFSSLHGTYTLDLQ